MTRTTIYKGERARITEKTDRNGKKTWTVYRKEIRNGRQTWTWNTDSFSEKFAREVAEHLENE